ncbi:reverse transcriptase domain, Reverse transcriptase zinc-binding domain protein [Artemisia annua]|uniref:Reverse transcriptase domain, Reverse transcriptase zinc-binding domain protein n=1 Tax=Artemisia annua TaxID=35608 RepID=A0A2U1KRD0_ARTAN|nr:reverse transcriptase domain, Reverse transcriptase zinc-binding domain protein [Artemisia annua]
MVIKPTFQSTKLGKIGGSEMIMSHGDRLLKWYPEKQVQCPLCEECPDSHEHLFFECPYSTLIWQDMKKRIKKDEWSDKWKEILFDISEMPCNNNIMSIMRRLVLAACVYYIWTERNKRIFSNEKKDYKEVLKDIISNIRFKMASLTVKDSNMVNEVYKQWKSP